MCKQVKDRPERDRPELPKTPFLCASCRHGLVLVQKAPLYDPDVCGGDAWKEPDAFRWHWEARCNNPKVAGRWPETFNYPVVDCEGFSARELA